MKKGKIQKIASQIRALTEAERIRLNYRIGYDDIAKNVDESNKITGGSTSLSHKRKILAKAKKGLDIRMMGELKRLKDDGRKIRATRRRFMSQKTKDRIAAAAKERAQKH